MDTIAVTLLVNGQSRGLRLDPRVTLLDALRDHLHLHGTKKVAIMGCAGLAPF